MKPALKTAIVIASILLLAALLNPPWINSYTKHNLGFHFISGSGVVGDFMGQPQIDYAKLIIIILSIGVASVATYFISTSGATHVVFSSLKRNLKPLASFFSWLEKYWLWILIAGMLLKIVAV